ncbi:Zinc transporter ZIP10 [Acipenser ruthenus]|uniref:Zinc transporter ZIP10 n=1 Tax=Acipenser ruthenus TaxID=7906 RepID=A0A444V766_ACIRT|nr:Zinc transporter ZIP10 [Acipenser ruthenus]
MTSLLPNTSGRLAPLCMLGCLAPLLLLLQVGPCWGQLERNRSEGRGIRTWDSSTTAGQGVLKSSTERVRGVLSPVEEAIEEQGYYLRRLFLQYGENETLSFGGLQRLLGSLGLGEVSVLEISHEGLGHDHVSHLDMLEVQENKHTHSHPPHEHAGNPLQETERRDPPAAPPLRDTTSTQPPDTPRMKPGQGPDPVRVWSRAGSAAVHPGIPGDLQGRSGHPVENHLHGNERGRQASEQEPGHSHQQGEQDLKLLERRGQQEADSLSGAPLDQEGGAAGGPLRREGSLGCRTAETTPHSHSHSHSHSVQGLKDAGIGSVAWMVIMGDGMHNFTDGLAIGAAFSQGVVGGLSTSVAVFCHELPHELGDFAVLLQAGLPLCRVLLVSLLSAVLGFLGMLVGVGVSQQSREVTPWIFSLTAGMFIYVALVDMLPEMLRGESSSQGKPKRLLLQHLGLLLGGALMLCIAVFEDKIILNVDF